MKIITAQQMYELEERANKEYSITQVQLMENAGRGVAQWIDRFVEEKSIPKEVLIICGGGNNAGDGFVGARYLQDMGFRVSVICLVKEDELKGPAKINYNKLKRIKKLSIYKAFNKIQLERLGYIFKDTPLILDCILGTGIKGEVKGFFREVIEYINSLSKKVISVDIPSGMDANTGNGLCIKANATLTMGLPKVGLLKPGIEDTVGYLHIIDIGLPQELVKEVKSNLEYIHPQDFSGLVPRRLLSSHKGNFGHVLVLAGSPQYTGAAALCAMGALRSGAGLVTLGVPRGLQEVYQIKLTESMTLALPETEEGTLSEDAYPYIMKFIENVDSVALGPGISKHPSTIKLVKKIISGSPKPLVIDADGVNAIAEELLVLRKAKAPLILTPHPGEMARLLHTSIKSVQMDRWKITRELADKYGITIVLKGFHSIVAGDDKKIYINSSGNPGMASGGMGDVLTGIIAGLLAQGFRVIDSVRLGVYIHGASGDLVASEKGEWGILASDLLGKLPFVMNRVYGR